MFDRYTEGARRVLFFGRYEASQLGSPAIEPEHLLLGLLRESRGPTARVLSDAGLNLVSVRAEILAGVKAQPQIPTSVEIPFTSSVKWALTFAAEEADALRHPDISLEHLLLGILREDKSPAARVLTAHGLRLPEVRARIVELRTEPPSAHIPGTASTAAAEPGVYVMRSRQPMEGGGLRTRSLFVWTIANSQLRTILAELYDTPEPRIDLPSDLDEDGRYDVSLVLGQVETAEEMTRRMRDGIEERLRMTVTPEARLIEVYVVTAPNGAISALKRSDDDSAALGSVWMHEAATLLDAGLGGPSHSPLPISGISTMTSVRGLCEMLERSLGRPVIDETNVTGTYEIDVRSDTGTTEGVFDALRDRLGLIVTPATREVPMLIVRRATFR